MLHSEHVKPVAHLGGHEKIATTLVGSSFVRLRNVSWLRGSVFVFAGISGNPPPHKSNTKPAHCSDERMAVPESERREEESGNQGDRKTSEKLCPPGQEWAKSQKPKLKAKY